jgi:hypothetical protein
VQALDPSDGRLAKIDRKSIPVCMIIPHFSPSATPHPAAQRTAKGREGKRIKPYIAGLISVIDPSAL